MEANKLAGEQGNLLETFFLITLRCIALAALGLVSLFHYFNILAYLVFAHFIPKSAAVVAFQRGRFKCIGWLIG